MQPLTQAREKWGVVFVEGMLWLTRRSPRLRRLLWRGVYEGIAGAYADETYWHCMNYGFAPSDAEDETPALSPEDEPERYALNLYHHVATSAEIEGRDVLEVGCGRGGGSSYIARYLRPSRMVGVDISKNAIQFCRSVHHAPNLEYRHGDAEALPFPDASFDVVVNIESSFCYGSMDGFITEVVRVLRPGGELLLADIRLAEEVAELDTAVAGSGLSMVNRRDITQNVAEALARDNDRRSTIAEGRVARPFRKLYDVFAGVEGTRMPVLLRSRDLIYLSYRLRKPLDADSVEPDPDLDSAAAL